MKKILILVLTLVLALSVGTYFYLKRPQNIFDEMYQATKRSYRHNNILGEINGFEIPSVWPSDSPNNKNTPFGKYSVDNLPERYSELTVSFNFKSNERLSSISFEKRIASGIKLRVWTRYNFKSKKLNKSIKVVLENSDLVSYVDNESEVKAYLNEYGITPNDLDNYYDEIVNQKVLKDWCSIYDSCFSPTDYGDVTVETQWEDW